MSAPDTAGQVDREPVRTPIGVLVDGFETISGLAIPYGLMPRHVRTSYGVEFEHWSDLAAETVQSLRTRPRAGHATVRTLLAAARAAVREQAEAGRVGDLSAKEAVGRLLIQLDDRDRVVLSARLWTHPPECCRTVAKRLGIHQTSVRRHQPVAQARLAELVANPVHREAVRWAAELRKRLGSYVPAHVVTEVLQDVNIEPGYPAQLLLYLAGPYVGCEGWFENTDTGGYEAAVAAVDDVITECATPTTETLVERLATVGMVTVAVEPFLARQELHRRDEVWMRSDYSMAGRIASALMLRGLPLTTEEAFTAVGEAPTLRSVLNVLSSDERFVRTSRTTWGLRDWGREEYRGLSVAIGGRIDGAGGSIGADELIDGLKSTFADISELSVRQNLRTLAFVVEDGVVRRRRSTDVWPPVGPLFTARGAFRNGDNEIRWAVPVTGDILRGSGGRIPSSVADALGVKPGQRREFSSPHGPVEVRWLLSSTNGPAIGSLRAPAQHTGAIKGDTLVVVFNLRHVSVSAVRIAAGTAGLQRLPLLLGTKISGAGGSAEAALAAGLGCDRSDVTAVLTGRGDGELAVLVRAPHEH